MASTDDIRITVQDNGVAVLQLDRPAKRNAFSQAMIGTIVQSLSALDANNDVRALVIAGSPEGPFCGECSSPFRPSSRGPPPPQLTQRATPNPQPAWISRNWSRSPQPLPTGATFSRTSQTPSLGFPSPSLLPWWALPYVSPLPLPVLCLVALAPNPFDCLAFPPPPPSPPEPTPTVCALFFVSRK